jgi:hypothetical protein
VNTQGPYFPHPYNQGGLNVVPAQTIPVLVGKNGFIEVINLTGFLLRVGFQSMGTILQEGRSKVIYKIVQDIQGTQMVTLIAPPKAFPALVPGGTGFFSIPLSNQAATGPNPPGVYLNSYEEGEIEWYPPVALGAADTQGSYFMQASAVSVALSMLLPNTSTVYGVAPADGICYLLGFDLSSGTPAAGNTQDLTISNLFQQPDGSSSLLYRYAFQTTAGIIDRVRFPTPIPNNFGTQITFAMPSASTTVRVNAYYSLT